MNDLEKLRAIFRGVRLPVVPDVAKRITRRIEAEIGRERHHWSSSNDMSRFNLVFYVGGQQFVVRNADIK